MPIGLEYELTPGEAKIRVGVKFKFKFEFIGCSRLESHVYLDKPVDEYAAHLRVDLSLLSIHVVGRREECLLQATTSVSSWHGYRHGGVQNTSLAW